MSVFNNHAAGDAPPDEKRRSRILIAVGVVGVLIAYLTFRRMAAGSSTSAAIPQTGAAGNAGSGAVDVSGLNGQIASLSDQLGKLSNQEASDVAGISGVQSQQQSLLDTLSGSVDTFNQYINNTTQTASGAPPNLPGAVSDAMKKNGEFITDVVKEGAGALYLTNKGGVYAVGPGGATSGAGVPQTFGQGSYLGYAASTPNPAAELAGHGDFSHGKLTLLPGGHYNETNNLGENYTF